MSFFASPRFLSRVMWFDAASCAGTGALQLALGAMLAALTGLPQALLTGTGVFLLAYAAVAAWVASRVPAPRTLIGLIAVGNVGWTVACVGLMLVSVFPLTGWGLFWLGAQALTTLILADLQWAGLRGTRSARVVLAA